MSSQLPVWRSLLFVPVTAKRFVDGAARRGADAIILDLEDSVAASEKERARTLVPEAAEIVSRGGADVVVRINRPLRLAVRDIEAAVGPGVTALALPKTDSPEHVPCRSHSRKISCGLGIRSSMDDTILRLRRGAGVWQNSGKPRSYCGQSPCTTNE